MHTAEDTSSRLFVSEQWAKVLQTGLGARTEIISIGGRLHSVSLFSRSVFTLGYLDFSSGMDTPLGCDDLKAIAEELGKREIPVDGIRYVSPFEPPCPDCRVASTQPRTTIDDLDCRRIFALKRVKKSLSPAKKYAIDISRETDRNLSGKIFEIYRNTIEIRQGNLRYTEAYFAALLELSAERKDVNVLIARVDGTLAGYLVLCFNGSDAYYLHGGYDRAVGHAPVTDKLLEQALLLAEEAGCRTFDLGESPSGNTGLISFKEKWGAVTRDSHTIEYPVNRLKSLAIRIITAVVRFIARLK